jgi:hypothetical protein
MQKKKKDYLSIGCLPINNGSTHVNAHLTYYL